MSSKLCIIPTPIGNLEDITLRALRMLKEADLILAEDTRTTNKLLVHYEIRNKIMSYHKYNEHQIVADIINRLKKGITIALITDAGTPCISDPGFLLVRECIKNNISVECLPGATALIPALVNSGLPATSFCFEGFLPHSKGRIARLKELSNEKRTMLFYESPHRLIKTLNQFIEYFGKERNASVSRELTKTFEENIRGTIEEILLYFKNKRIKGEIVIVVEGKRK